MKKSISILILAALTSSFAWAQTSASKSRMSGSATSDHIQAMMDECMRMNKDDKVCQQQMNICKKNMSDPVCDKIHQSMKKSK